MTNPKQISAKLYQSLIMCSLERITMHAENDHAHDDHDHSHAEDNHTHAKNDHAHTGDEHDHDHDDHGHAHGDHDHAHGGGLRGLLGEIFHTHSHSGPRTDRALESSERGIWALKVSLAGLLATALFQVVIVVL